MSQAQSTRCPHCQTAFRVTPEQLAVAKGAVRCGSCLEVFNALEHPLNSPSVSATSSSTDMTDRVDDDDEDFLFMDDDEADQAEPEYEDAKAPGNGLEFSDSFLSLDEAEEQSTPSSSHLREESDYASSEPAADDSWALEMLADMEKESHPEPPLRHDEWSLSDDSDQPPAAFSPRPEPGGSRQREQRPADESRDNERAHLEAAFAAHELDQLSQYQADFPENRRWPWAVALGTLAVLLVLQLAWWERANLSQQPALHGLYVGACSLVGCTVPEPAPDAGAIRALSSVLRPLPDGQMRLDAVFVNRSDRPSPYPVLKLEIQDFQGTVTADGLFVPEDYVGGEVQPGDMMPPGRPVSISINMNRPVEELNNFRLTFHY